MADLSFMNDFEKSLDKMENVSRQSTPPSHWYNTGNYVLNYILSGKFDCGIPVGRVTALAGPSGSGKSFIQCNVAAHAQEDDAIVVMIDSEGALDDEFTSKIGIDPSNPAYYYVSTITIDDTIKIASNFMKGYKKDHKDDMMNGPKVLLIIDSLDMLLTNTENTHFEKGDGKGDQGQRAKQIKAFLRNMVQQVKNTNIALVVTHQVYEATQEMILKGKSDGNWVINNAVKYSLSHLLLLTKLKLKDGAEISGIKMKCQAVKTRFTKPFQDVVIEVPYDKGMDPYSGLCEVAEALGVISSRGSRKYFTEDGKDGSSFYAKSIADHKDRLFSLIEQMDNASIEMTDTLGLEENLNAESKPQQAKRRKNRITAISDQMNPD